jgi:hypothetical protein
MAQSGLNLALATLRCASDELILSGRIGFRDENSELRAASFESPVSGFYDTADGAAFDIITASIAFCHRWGFLIAHAIASSLFSTLK